ARLRAIRLAAIGPAWEGGPARLAGYAADNGALPGNLAALLTQPDSQCADPENVNPDLTRCFRLKTPVFDPTPDLATGLVSGTDGESLSGQQLLKGWRGPYLELAPGSSTFRDGWGNRSAAAADDNSTFGWGFEPFTASTAGAATIITPLRVTSLGKDGLAGAAGGFDADTSLSIAATDWLVDIANWRVRLNGGQGAWYSVSLLVYQDAADGGHWRRLSTAPVDGSAPASGPSVACGDISASQGMVYLDSSCGAQELRFPPNVGYPSGSVSSLVPYGRHLLVVVRHTAGGSAQTALPNQAWATTVDLVRGALPPAATLEVRS
ncbi:MAG TPA: hypothetical protein VGC24_01880, partial [Burkholderiaceae bacterium]